MTPGQRLRLRREKLGFLLRDVESASGIISTKKENPEFEIAVSKLSDIELKSRVPSVHCLQALAIIYRLSFAEVLSWYGITANESASDFGLPIPSKTTLFEGHGKREAYVPVRLDPGFDMRKTTSLGRMIQRWGTVPMTMLEAFANLHYTYAYVGTEDFTMYPILLPGSFVQVDESQSDVVNRDWPSEYERPIYLVQLRDGSYLCCWCRLNGERLTLQPHPRSPVEVTVKQHPQEAEVIGKIVGIAMRLDRISSEKPHRAFRLSLNV